MEKIWVFYGKTEALTGRVEERGEKGRTETRAGRMLLKHALKQLYGFSFPEGEGGTCTVGGHADKGTKRQALFTWLP